MLETLRRHLHFRWQYAPHDTDVASTADSSMADYVQVQRPAPEQIEALLTLARKGHLKKLLITLDELEHSGPHCFDTFTGQVRHIARSFQMNQLCRFLEYSLHAGE